MAAVAITIPSNETTDLKFQYPAEDERERQLRELRRDWRMLASEWLALAGALEQFEQEFESLEQNLNRRWERKDECFRWETSGTGPIA